MGAAPHVAETLIVVGSGGGSGLSLATNVEAAAANESAGEREALERLEDS